MWELAWKQLRSEASRACAIILAYVCALSSCVLLVGHLESERLTVHSTLSENWRASYDILVRPAGTRTENEKSRGVVRPDFLSGIYGGLSFDVLQRIREIQDVDIAAPVAMFGAVDYSVSAKLDISASFPGFRRALLRADATALSYNGLFSIENEPRWTYLTSSPLSTTQVGDTIVTYEHSAEGIHEVCSQNERLWNDIVCESAEHTILGQRETLQSPYLEPYTISLLLPIAAIDPEAEARLIGLDKTIVAGRYLPSKHEESEEDARYLPVLVNRHAGFGDLSIKTHVRAYAGHEIDEYVANGFSGEIAEKLDGITPENEFMLSAQFSDYWNQFLQESQPRLDEDTSISQAWFTTPELLRPGPIEYAQQHTPQDEEQLSLIAQAHRPARYIESIPASLGPSYRNIERLASRAGGEELVRILPVGHFDMQSAPTGRSDMESLNLFVQPEIIASSTSGESEPYLPSLSAGSYSYIAPALVTDLDTLTTHYRHVRPDLVEAPISAIRIRVAGITEMNDVSAERIRVVAEKISEIPGVEVDVVAGSSPGKIQVTLPAYSPESHEPIAWAHTTTVRPLPHMELTESWPHKGVATSIERVLDTTTASLGILILVSMVMSVGCGCGAFVKAQVRKLEVLPTLGWTRCRCSLLIGMQLFLLAVCGGFLSLGLVLILRPFFSPALSTGQAFLVIPIALATPVVVWPFIRQRGRKKVKSFRMRSRSRNGSLTSARIAISRLKIRTWWRILGIVAPALSVAILSLTLWVYSEYHGSIVGTVLGDLVSLKVRGADILASAALALLGIMTIAVIVWLGVLEDLFIFSVLTSSGWRDRDVNMIVVVQVCYLCGCGALVGAPIALLCIALLGEVSIHTAALVLSCAVGYVMVSLGVGILLVRYARKEHTRESL